MLEAKKVQLETDGVTVLTRHSIKHREFYTRLPQARPVVIVDVLPAENLFSRQCVQLWAGWNFLRRFVRHPTAPHHRRGKPMPTVLSVIGTGDKS
jgi:hypothetical protein